MEDKRLIEVDFPLKEVSEESAREKSIRHGHLSTLHVWWARRPLAASRATTFAALIPVPPKDELVKKLDFIVKLSIWENSLNSHLIEEAKKSSVDFFEGKNPKVLDCFAGGGAIPLEASRLGCETYALEYNPVAVLLLKATLEYPQKFGRKEVKTEGGLRGSQSNRLSDDVKKWGNWVLEEVKKEIQKFYPNGKDGSIPVGYIWSRTIRCQNPSCLAEIPLLKQFWLAKRESRKVALKPVIDKREKEVKFEVAENVKTGFDPSEGTVRGGSARCLICGSTVDNSTMLKEAKEGKMGQRLIAVIMHNERKIGKTYQCCTEDDVEIFKSAMEYLKELKANDDRLSLIPDESLPSEGTLGISSYWTNEQGSTSKTWGDLFNERQALAIAMFCRKIRDAYNRIKEEVQDANYAKAIITYLAMALDRLIDRCCRVSRWNNAGEKIEGYSGHKNSLPIVWDYIELNPFSGVTGSWDGALNWVIGVIKHCSFIRCPSTVLQGTATRLPYSNNFFDAVITDPPYYSNVPYSDLSDFFYVWLKRAVGEFYQDLFSTPLTPKSQEIIMHPARHGGDAEKAKQFFENMITQSFTEIHRVLKPEGIAVIVFAYKSTDAWETIINSLLKSGLVLTASWPIHTERAGRLRAQESAALASSVYMVCRKRTEEKITYFNEIRDEIDQRIKEKLTQFWEQGISGADFFVSAIGPAVEVFGKYSKVEKLSGEEVLVQELLEYVRKVVSEFALERVLKRADLGGVDAETRFYLLWRWTFGSAKVHFDDAIKLSRPMGVELTAIWDRGELVKKEKEFIQVLDPKERAKDPSFMKKTKFTSMIDVLHYAVILWERGEREKIKEILNETGYAGNEIFWQSAQAISEVLPQGDKEKQLLQGFLYGKEAYVKEAARGKKTLLDFTESG